MCMGRPSYPAPPPPAPAPVVAAPATNVPTAPGQNANQLFPQIPGQTLGGTVIGTGDFGKLGSSKGTQVGAV